MRAFAQVTLLQIPGKITNFEWKTTGIMTQDQLWINKYIEIRDFMEKNHRKPSKYAPEERDMHNWWKHNKKLLNAGELRSDRVELFNKLLEAGEKYRRVNQWQ